MLKIKIFLSAVFLTLFLWVSAQHVSAASNSVVIYQVFSGVASASQEFVALYNTSDSEVDITSWCLTNKNTTEFACFNAGPDSEIVIAPRQFITIGSTSLSGVVNIDLPLPDTNAIIGAADIITLSNAAKVPIDSVDWATSLETGKALQRKFVSPGNTQDTDVSTVDFEKLLSPPFAQNVDLCRNIAGIQNFQPAGTIIDAQSNCVAPPPIDLCINIEGNQSSMPIGYSTDGAGGCYVDICTNLDGLQIALPEGYDPAPHSTCVIHDECMNLPDAQQIVPPGYRANGGNCELDLLPLQVTELLPNATGVDAGKEYIELYNPTDRVADLAFYAVYVGLNGEKSYPFPAGNVLGPGEFKIFYDTDIPFTLANTAGRVGVGGVDGTLLMQTDAYANAGDDYAWAYVNGTWQYTNQPTPGSANLAFLEPTEELTSTVATASCPGGKYRHPLTNRCRNIESDASVLASCEADQYRNPDTGRCRKIATAASLAPCKDGQYRSEETNRCRNVETASAQLAACKEGQERNPDTNRCRNQTPSAIPNAAFAVEPVKEGAKGFVGWLALGGVTTLALGYAGWEWRREIAEKIKGIGRVFTFRK